MNLRVLIVDDEPLARRGVRARLKDLPDITIVGECPDAQSAIEAIKRTSPNLIFLDVQMPAMTGFEMLRMISEDRIPFIIFLTAYDQYALRAFEVHALDYLLKPIDDDRFMDAVKRARRQIELHSDKTLEDRLKALLADQASQRSNFTERFAIRIGSRIAFVLADEIDWIGSAGDYASLHVGKKTHLLRETLNNLESRLDPSRFIRIHRSAIVQATRINSLLPLPNREFRVLLHDGTELKASRSYRDRLDHWLS